MNIKKQLRASLIVVKETPWKHLPDLTSWCLRFRHKHIIVGTFNTRQEARDYRKKYVKESLNEFRDAIKKVKWLGLLK